ncbi:hypothetical protein NAT51_00020 [Flavobacterium amniphilum]|uniref:hypothetical protein n=1 Tax=Flavobacterium amniphilum TaxID=1834035 RepID=UPI00202A59BB|nr:hypothetical protein [Flavobacterium amniphilum]MCL9803889.1 hypothetical protein [Flavobacterium amniphilum]
MKKIVTISLCFLFMLFYSSCAKQHLKKFEEKDHYFDNSSVLGLNAVNADNNYYTKAILEYLLVKGIIDGNSEIRTGKPKYSPKENREVTQMLLFPGLSDKETVNNNNYLSELKESGIRPCVYDLPKELKDLKSGFQFNHYVFKGSNRAAMQAFGIVASEAKDSTLYIITDYLQYQDVNCTGLPTIRYAVGIRAQFRIARTDSETELKGVSSLAGLAAQVETDQRSVNITVKTIGITGIDSRVTIPSNTTFDVRTYSDYEKVIDFIKNLKTEKANLGDTLIIQPQLIPVMDDYRTTIEHTFHSTYETIELLETKLKELEDKKDNSEVDKLRKEIKDIKLSMLKKEIEGLKNNREELIIENKEINDYSRYSNLLEMLNRMETRMVRKEEAIVAKDSSKSLNGKKYIIVFSADGDLEQAKYEKGKLKKSKIDSEIVLRKNSYRNISKLTFASIGEAEKYKKENESSIRFDAYIVDSANWCSKGGGNGEYFTCE